MELLEWLPARAGKSADDLVRATLERGASDNVAVIIARTED
jgi:serine/threonine protein phosphatase PrpC